MKLKNSQIINAVDALNKLSEANLPIRQAYNLSKTLTSIKRMAKAIYAERDKLIIKYGEKQEDGSHSIAANNAEGKAKFIEDYSVVLDIEEEVDVRKLSLDDLDGVMISANDLENIEFMIDFPAEPNDEPVEDEPVVEVTEESVEKTEEVQEEETEVEKKPVAKKKKSTKAKK